MPRRKEGLGPAFSCRLREDQDKELRAEAAERGEPLVTTLRRWVDERRYSVDLGNAVEHLSAQDGDGDAD